MSDWKLLFLLPFLVAAEKLTSDENNLLQARCGQMEEPYIAYNNSMLRSKRALVAYGKASFFHDAPWSAWIDPSGCTATWISSRHLLTAAHCFYLDWGNNCAIGGPLKNNVIQVILGCTSNDPFYQKCDSLNAPTTYKISTVYVLNSITDCTGHKALRDIALIEVGKPEKYVHQPACLPAEDLTQAVNVSLFGYGFTEGDKSAKKLNKMSLTLDLSKVTDTDAVQDSVVNSTSCQGDSGGGYMADVNGKITIVTVHHGRNGLNGMEPPSCGAINQGSLQKSTILSRHLDWICLLSGVCPKKGQYEEVAKRRKDVEKIVKVIIP